MIGISALFSLFIVVLAFRKWHILRDRRLIAFSIGTVLKDRRATWPGIILGVLFLVVFVVFGGRGGRIHILFGQLIWNATPVQLLTGLVLAVLVALLFILAAQKPPAMSSRYTLTVLSPQGPVKKSKEPAPRLGTLEGKKIAMWLSSTADQVYAGRGAELYDALAKMLKVYNERHEKRFMGSVLPRGYVDYPAINFAESDTLTSQGIKEIVPEAFRFIVKGLTTWKPEHMKVAGDRWMPVESEFSYTSASWQEAEEPIQRLFPEDGLGRRFANGAANARTCGCAAEGGRRCRRKP